MHTINTGRNMYFIIAILFSSKIPKVLSNNTSTTDHQDSVTSVSLTQNNTISEQASQETFTDQALTSSTGAISLTKEHAETSPGTVYTTEQENATPTNPTLHTSSTSKFFETTTFNDNLKSSEKHTSNNVSTTYSPTLSTMGGKTTNFSTPQVSSTSYKTEEISTINSIPSTENTIEMESSSISISLSGLISTVTTSNPSAIPSETTHVISKSTVNSPQTTSEYENTDLSVTTSTTMQSNTQPSLSVTVIDTTEPKGSSTPHLSSSTNSTITITTTRNSSLTSTYLPHTMISTGIDGTNVSDKTSTNEHSITPGLVNETATDMTETETTGSSTTNPSSSTPSLLSTTLSKTTTRPASFTPNIDNAVFTIHFKISLKKCENESEANKIEIAIKKNLTENVTELVSIKLLRLGCSRQSKRKRRSGDKHFEGFAVSVGFHRSAKGNESQIGDNTEKALGGIHGINVTGIKSEIESHLREELNDWCRSDVCRNEIHSNKGYECKNTTNKTGCLIQSICLSDKAYCRYGARCEIKVVENTYQPGCRCEDTTFFTFTGSHCEKKSLKLEIALYTAGVIGVAIIITFLVIILLMRRSGQKKSVQKEPLMLDSPGHGSEEFTNIQSFDNQSYNRDYESNWDMEKSADTYDYIDSKLSEVNYSMQIKRPKLVSTYY